MSECGKYAYQVEPWAPFRDESAALLPRHWDELTLEPRGPFAMDWQRYEALDSIGALSLVTMREDGRLVGYSTMIVATAMHSRTSLEAYMDFFWVAPEARGHMGGLRLFRTQERELKRRGVQRMNVGSRLHKDASRLFAAMGYTPYEMWLTKWLGDN